MRIVVLDGYACNPGDLSWEEFSRYGDLMVYPRTKAEDTVQRIADAEVVFTNKTVIDRSVLENCPNLKMVGVLATGYNVVDIAAARERGITVCNVPAYSTQAVAQMTFALLLEVCQQVGAHTQAVRQGRWEQSKDFCFWEHPLTELAGKTMGVIGYGTIGKGVAEIAKAMGMQVLVTSRSPKSVPEGVRFVTISELLSQSDVVSLHCPQTAENLHMICQETISLMKDGAILLNTARGGLVDEQALAGALKSGKLRAYGADVVSREPILGENPLLTAPNCFLTPHIAWAAKETRARLLQIAAENLRAFLAGAPQNIVSP